MAPTPNLNGLTNEEKEIGWIIDRINYIEFLLKEIISYYIQPDKNKEKFVKDILLNNAIIALGSKIKLFLHICKVTGWKIKNPDNYHDILRYRNAFAHNDTVKININISLGDKSNAKVNDVYMMLDRITSSGEFVQERRKDVIQKFTDTYVLIKKELDEIVQHIKSQNK
jgi:hypothetical protein